MKTQIAYEQIKKLVLDHTFSRGQRVVCSDLVEKLKMSRTPIINALSKLEQEEYVHLIQNKGFYIREFSVDEVAEIFDIREKLEEDAAEFAFENHSQEKMDDLKKKVLAYLNYPNTFYDKNRLDLDTDFHMCIARMGNRKFFASMISRFYETVYFRINIAQLSPYINKFGEEHKQIYEAMREKKLSKTKAIIRKHTRDAKKMVLSQLIE